MVPVNSSQGQKIDDSATWDRFLGLLLFLVELAASPGVHLAEMSATSLVGHSAFVTCRGFS